MSLTPDGGRLCCAQNLINVKELGHYGSIVSGSELEVAAEKRLAEHAAAAASSRGLIAALQERERDASGTTQHASQQHQDASRPEQRPRKLSKRARHKMQKVARAIGSGKVEPVAPAIGKTRCHRPLHRNDAAPRANATVDATGTQHPPANATLSAARTTTTTN